MYKTNIKRLMNLGNTHFGVFWFVVAVGILQQ